MDGNYTLITGGAGFVGSNLADALLSDGEPVVIADSFRREGVRRNARWLRQAHPEGLRVEEVDVRDEEAMSRLVGGARAVYHLAGQVAVTTSIEDPRDDLQSNVVGTFNILEAARRRSDPPGILFTSTNKVYGRLAEVPVEASDDGYRFADGRPGIDESTRLDFRSPYGCSKGAADQYVRDYARIFGLPTVVFRMSCIYGDHQFGTEDQGWVAHFARALLAGRSITIFGDGYQVRDILWVGDLVRAMRTAMDRSGDLAGYAFNIGGGPRNAVSLRDVIGRLMEITGREIPVRMDDWRTGDQRVYVTDVRRAERVLDWQPTVHWQDGLERLVAWLRAAGLDTFERPAAPPRAVAGVAVSSAVG